MRPCISEFSIIKAKKWNVAQFVELCKHFRMVQLRGPCHISTLSYNQFSAVQFAVYKGIEQEQQISKSRILKNSEIGHRVPQSTQNFCDVKGMSSPCYLTDERVVSDVSSELYALEWGQSPLKNRFSDCSSLWTASFKKLKICVFCLNFSASITTVFRSVSQIHVKRGGGAHTCPPPRI